MEFSRVGAAPDRPLIEAEVADGRFILVSGQIPVCSARPAPGPIGENHQFDLDPYPGFQEYLRTHQPPDLIIWGKSEPIFGAGGARAYLRDLPDAGLHRLDTGPFAFETHGDEISRLISNFLRRKER